nr:Ig-like domain-containing protein [Chryseosolibacter indicus]
MNENQNISFWVKTTEDRIPVFSIEGIENLNIHFDSLGNFSWKPSYDLVDRVQRSKDFSFVFRATWRNGKRASKTVTFTVNHVNRPPVVEEIPAFYVKQSSLNSYQIPGDFVFDPDGDPIIIKSVQSQLPEGANLNSQGLLTWSPSRSQFSSLKKDAIYIDFIVQDQPDKAETKGRIRVAPTQLDLPPEILILPADSLFSIKEDEPLNLKLYISDPNGDDNIRSAGFIGSDTRIPSGALKENTQLQYEFIWLPGYEFADDIKKVVDVNLTFYAVDKSNNRSQKKIKVRVNDAENMLKKDAHLFQKYRSNLVDAAMLIQQLDANQKKLNQEYKKARKGKKHRSILNASLGAVTGLSPVVIETPDQSKIVSGVGGTTVLTLGTLEATEVIGRSKESIMERIKNGIEIRNRVQASGDEFARKYVLKSARRNAEFDKDIEKLRAVLNDQRIVLLELDSFARNPSKIDDKEIKRHFVDYGEDTR